MSEPENQDHWNSLANQLGAVPPPGPEKPSKKRPAKQTKRPQSTARSLPPTTKQDWTQVAKELEIAPPEPLSSDAIRWRPKATASDSVQDAGDAVREQAPSQPQTPARNRGEAASTGSPPIDSGDEPAVSGAEADTAESGPTAAEVAGSGESEAAYAESSASWVEESENAPVVRRRKRRRRRGRSKTAQADAKQVETTDKPALSEEAPENEAPDANEQDAAKAETGPDSSATSETTSRPRRRKRRRGRPKDSPKSDDAEKQNKQPEVYLELQSADTDVPQAEADHAPDRVDANTSTDNVEQPESESTESRDERDHRNIPSWEEAVGVIVDKNIEAHSKNPGPSRSRGRGRGRGRGRS